MAKQVLRLYSKSDELMLQQAAVIYQLLAGNGTPENPGDLGAFNSEFTNINPAWLAAFLVAIDAADDTPGDDEIVTDQQLSTLAVETVMALSRKRISRLYAYADITYPDNPLAKDIFGNQSYRKNRYVQTGLKEVLQVAYKKANTEPYRTDLINNGFAQDRIDELNTLAQNLETTNTTQEVKKTDRPVITQDRIIKHNEVWELWGTITTASKVVFEDNYAKQQQYLLYPEAGNDSGSIVESTLNPGATAIVFSGSVLKPESKFNALVQPGTPTGSFYLYAANSADEGFSGSGVYISSAAEVADITWDQLGGQKPFVKVYNPTGEDVDYRVEIV